jgi:hypothetical protein
MNHFIDRAFDVALYVLLVAFVINLILGVV